MMRKNTKTPTTAATPAIIDDGMTLEQLAAIEAAAQQTSGSSAFARFMTIGKAYFVFSPEFYWIGRVVDCDAEGVVFSEAVWVTYTGALQDTLSRGTLMTALPMNRDVYVPRDRLSAVWEWKHAIPTQAVDR